jgi:hypothetical protein
MTVPAANEGGVVVILAIGPQANARAGPEDRNLVEKVVMVLHRSEISDAAQTGRQAFHPGCHERDQEPIDIRLASLASLADRSPARDDPAVARHMAFPHSLGSDFAHFIR